GDNVLVSPAAIVRFAKPVNPKALLNKNLPDIREQPFLGKTYYTSEEAGAAGVAMGAFVPDAKTLLIGPEPTLQKMLIARDVSSPLVNQLKAMSFGAEMTGVLAVEPVREVLTAMVNENADGLPPPLKRFRSLPELVDTVAISVGLTGSDLIQIGFEAKDKQAARRLTEMAGAALISAKGALRQLRAAAAESLPPEDAEPLTKLLADAERGIRVDQDANRIVFSLKKPDQLALRAGQILPVLAAMLEPPDAEVPPGEDMAVAPAPRADTDDLKQLSVSARPETLGPAKWKRHKSREAGFSADFPGEPEHSTEEDEGVTHTYSATQPGTNIAYSVVYDDLGEAPSEADRKAILKGVAESLAEMTENKKDVRVSGHPGMEVLLKFEEDGVPLACQNRVCIVGSRLFQVMVTSPADEEQLAEVDRFLSSFRLLSEAAPEPVMPPEEPTVSGRSYKLGGRSRWPSLLERGQATATRDRVVASGDIRTKSGAFLNKDFKFEVVFPLKKGDRIVFVGFGESSGRNSVFLRGHHEYLRSGVGLGKGGQRSGFTHVGGDLPTGTHRAIITKQGDAVTFAIDVDDDGPTDDDMELTVPDIKAWAPGLHSKNARLFFGGGGGFQEVKLTHYPPATRPSTSDRSAKPRGGPARPGTNPNSTPPNESHRFGGRSPWPSFLEPSLATATRDGLVSTGEIRTKSGRFLNKDFKFEVVFPMKKGSRILIVGIGESSGRNSVFLRAHHAYLRSGVGLGKGGQRSGFTHVGGDLPTGTHRAIITKKGDTVTFAIDVDNDGPTDDDMKLTVPDIRGFQPGLHSKNTHLFFGSGTFKEVKLTYDRVN
ncbi:MAG: hypothetical protein ACYS9X_17010, partial [Planctomycetota bacterium]